MTNLKYTINFFGYWHCGCGLAAGADVDELVLKDRNNLPYIPGKTIKGLLRENIEDYFTFLGTDVPSDFVEVFGNSEDRNHKKYDKQKDNRYELIVQGKSFFKNATLPIDVSNTIKGCHAEDFMIKEIASTAIQESTGTAKKNTLRKIEVVVPCTLEGEIINIPNAFVPYVEIGFKLIKRLGENRNRGLGRCSFNNFKTEVYEN